jgi:TM2 domain-containing membrane protein YozV
MFCPKCGAQNIEGAQFCASCGQKVGAAAPEQPHAPPPYGSPPEQPGQYYNQNPMQAGYEQKSWLIAVLLSFFLGTFGIDRFYTGQNMLGILKLVTFGGCGIWWFIDFILYALDSVKDSNGVPLKK